MNIEKIDDKLYKLIYIEKNQEKYLEYWKILRKNTGSLCYGSMASPMVNGQGGSAYKFNHIVAPYETCKEIKNAINEFKNKTEKK